MERELDSVVNSSMAFNRSYYAKTARQLAKVNRFSNFVKTLLELLILTLMSLSHYFQEAEQESQQSQSGKYRKITTVESKTKSSH